MASKRRLVFTNGYWYHVFNRGIEGRPIFLSDRDYKRFISILSYYQYENVPMRYSFFIQLSFEKQKRALIALKEHDKQVTVASYCLMPNHFHLLIRQNSDDAIRSFMRDVENSFSKYFNTKNTRIGPLFQGVFKAVFVETDEQLLHVSRYIHINPYVSSLVPFHGVFTYPWSSLRFYDTGTGSSLVETDHISGLFPSASMYRKFVIDQMKYAKERKQLEHLFLE